MVPASAPAPDAAAPPQEEEARLKPNIRPMLVKPIPGRSAPPLGAPSKQELADREEAKKDDKKAEGKIGDPDSKAKTESIEEEAPRPKARSALTHSYKPKLSSEDAGSTAAAGTAPAATSATPATPSAAAPSSKAIAKASALVNKPVVALVGPVSANKADAEATLARMRSMLSPSQGGAGGAALQAQVFQTPEGWRPAVWPFASREEAQLINATLIARGMRTRAVDF